MFFVSLAAKSIDPEAFAWLVFTRATKMRLTGYNQRHVLTLAKGDIFGVRRTRSNTFQIVKSDSLHVLYRNVTPAVHERILKNSIAYKGPPVTPQEVEDGFVRQRRVATREADKTANKRIDDFFKPKDRIVEKYQIDQNNYQWRKVIKSPIRVVTKKQGKSKAIVKPGELVGLRYQTPARGGYVLVDGNVRVHISHEMYVELVQGSRVLPERQQKTDIVDLGSGLSEAEIAKTMQQEKQDSRRKKKTKTMDDATHEEEPIPKLYDIDDLSEEDVLEVGVQKRSRKQKNLRRMVRKLLEVQEQDVWVDEDGGDFEDDSIDKAPDEDLEDVDHDKDTGDVDAEDSALEDTDEDGEGEDEDDDLEDGDPDSDEDLGEDDLGESKYRDDEHVADLLEPGVVIKMKKGNGRTFVVVEAAPMERNENLMEYILHDPKTDEDDSDYSLYRLRLNVNMPMSKFEESAEITEDSFGDEELKSIQDTVEYADIKSISFVK